MNFLKQLAYTNFWVAFCLIALTSVQFIAQTTPWSFGYSIVIFSGILFIYNFQRLLKKGEEPIDLKNETSKKILSSKIYVILIGVIGCIGVFFLSFLEVSLLLMSLLITILYLPPIIHKSFSLRSIPYLKIFVITIVWTIITLGKQIVLMEPMQIVGRFLWIFSITIPFDIRDVSKDKILGLKTIPMLLGVKYSKWLSFAFFGLGLKLENVFESNYSLLLLFFAIGVAILSIASEKRGDMYFMIGIEALSICYCLFALLNVYS